MRTNSEVDSKRNQLARYQILMQHMEYLDRLFWSRVQTLHLIQAGVLAGSFYLRGQDYHPFLSLSLLSLGIVLTGLLFIICKFNWNDVEENKKSLYPLGDALGIRWSAERPSIFGKRVYGHIILYFIVILFLLVDLGLLLYFIFHR